MRVAEGAEERGRAVHHGAVRKIAHAGAVGGAPSRTPSAAGQRTPSGLTRSGTARSTSGDSTAGGVATPRNQRSGSPATLKEREREPREDKDEKRD